MQRKETCVNLVALIQADECGSILVSHQRRPGAVNATAARNEVRAAVVKLVNRYFPHASIAWEDGRDVWRDRSSGDSQHSFKWLVHAIDGEVMHCPHG
jgi:hypothetical protein